MDYIKELIDIYAVLIPLITMGLLARFGVKLLKNCQQGKYKKIIAQTLICYLLTVLSLFLALEADSNVGFCLSCVCFGATCMMGFFTSPFIKSKKIKKS